MKEQSKEFWAYAVGMCSASVCSSLPIEAVTARLNREHLTGIDSKWAHSLENFRGGEPNPCQCPDLPASKHYLFHC